MRVFALTKFGEVNLARRIVGGLRIVDNFMVFKNKESLMRYYNNQDSYALNKYYIEHFDVNTDYGRVKQNTIYISSLYLGYDYNYASGSIYDVQYKDPRFYSSIIGLKSESHLFHKAQIMRNKSEYKINETDDHIWIEDDIYGKGLNGIFFDDVMAGKFKYDILKVTIV